MPPSKKQKSEAETVAPIVYHEPKVMAEIGCNHMGQLEIAKELLTLAKQCGCEYGKFQKRCPKELLTAEQYAAPHPNPRNSYGDTYGAHREFLELNVDQHRELKEHCDKIGLGYSCSVWDLTSAKEIASLKPDLIKVGSPSNQHWEMQKVLRDEYEGDVRAATPLPPKGEGRCEGRTGDDLCATRRSTSRFSTCCTGQFPGFWVEFRVFRAGKEASISPAITSSRAATMGGNAESLETKRVAPRGPRGNTKRHRAGPTARL